MKLNFLLGSGISIPAGLPKLQELTDLIFTRRGTDQSDNSALVGYRPDKEREREDERRVLIFLDWLKAQASCRYADMPERRVNYEDLAYLADQIADDIGYEYENPGLQPFVRNALIELAGIFPNSSPSAAREKLKELARSAIAYIRQTVFSALHATPDKQQLRYLHFFVEASLDDTVTEVNAFTLNHDTLLQDFLHDCAGHQKIVVADGWRYSNDDRCWDGKVYDRRHNGCKCIKIFPLHGSIGRRRKSAHPRIPSNGPTPLLSGFNKLYKYNAGVFLDLHYRFYRALKDEDCKCLIVCGYGLGDKGINTRIVEWRRRSLDHRLVIVDPASAEDLFKKARGAIKHEISPILSQCEVHSSAQKTEENSLDAIVSEPKPVGPVRYLQKGIGRRPTQQQIQLTTWKEIRQLIEENG
jgi:hypothetical protein